MISEDTLVILKILGAIVLSLSLLGNFSSYDQVGNIVNDKRKGLDWHFSGFAGKMER